MAPRAKNRNELVYFMLNKPLGCVSSKSDILNRGTIYSVAQDAGFPIKSMGHVGRLDRETSGLLLFTNDIQLSLSCTCITYKGLANPADVAPLKKKYKVGIAGCWSDSDTAIQLLREPLFYPGLNIWTKPVDIKIIKSYQLDDTDPWPFLPYKRWLTEIEFTLVEGRNRQIRRLCTRSRLQLRTLHRQSFGPIDLGFLRPGECRYLSSREVEQLYEAAMPLNEVPLKLSQVKQILSSKFDRKVVKSIVSYLRTRV